MISSDISQTETLKAELVIIGGGGAGLAAATTALENGVTSVIVIEKRSALGGNSACALGLFAVESQVQKRNGIYASKETLYKKAMEWSYYSVDPRIVRAFIDKSGDTIRWLEEKGINFAIRTLYPGQSIPVWHVPAGNGATLIKALIKECQDGGIQFLMRTEAKKIIRGKEGEIAGVVVNCEGEEYRIATKRIIITTGGFGANEELLKKYCRTYTDEIDYGGLPNTGDGLRIAQEMGAAIEDSGTMISEGPFVKGSLTLRTLVIEPQPIWLNKNGQRFIDETLALNQFISGNALLRQPGKVCFVLFDTDLKRRYEEKGILLGRGPNKEQLRKGWPSLEQDLQKEITEGRMITSKSWDEIAKWIGANTEDIKTAIEEYNHCCDKGYDAIFAKDPKYLFPLRTHPFYVIKSVTTFCDTIGGIRINEKMEVLDLKNQTIPGLYAAGVTTSGWEGEIYCSELPGSAFGFAINSGRIAAENVISCISTNR
jgi:fumarate reductase flavoprotein subunit